MWLDLIGFLHWCGSGSIRFDSADVQQLAAVAGKKRREHCTWGDIA
jgi:hypothetical protein